MSVTTAAIRVIVPMVPGPVLSPNASRTVHWGVKARARNELKRAAWAACLDVRPVEPVAGPVRVTARICWPKGRKRMDIDNATACLKSMLDGCTAAGMWRDDRQIVELAVEQERLDKAGNREWPGGCIVVDIEEVV